MIGRDAFGRRLARHDGGCPDCGAYSELFDSGGGVYVLAVRHDETCPSYRAMERSRQR